jgi:hypothetical protein
MVTCRVLGARRRGTLLQSVVLLLLAAALSGTISSARALNIKSEDLFVGWQGESYKPAARSEVCILKGKGESSICILASRCYSPVSACQQCCCHIGMSL